MKQLDCYIRGTFLIGTLLAGLALAGEAAAADKLDPKMQEMMKK